MCRVWNVQSVDSSFSSGFSTGILLSLITCGICSYYFIYKLAEEVNIACEEMVSRLRTCCIYFAVIHYGIMYYWYYIGKSFGGKRCSLQFKFPENGTTVLMWCIFGAFLCGIGRFLQCTFD
ncbi:MAG: DUF4234 domain-containing protein [Clostridium sp.]